MVSHFGTKGSKFVPMQVILLQSDSSRHNHILKWYEKNEAGIHLVTNAVFSSLPVIKKLLFTKVASFC